jgi:hypothetical protein
MKTWLQWLALACVLVMAGAYVWNNRHHVASAVAVPATKPAEQPEPAYAEAREAQQMVTVTGPLANYMAGQTPPSVETLKPVLYKPSAADRVGLSPVGTTWELLGKTFVVSGIVDVPFELPMHAATPQLHGSFRSFPQPSDPPSTSAEGNIDFMVLNERQYLDLMRGRYDEAVFTAEQTHAQEINTSLPPTLDRPADYHLVFRNNGASGKKVVQASFQIDF